MNFKEEIQKLLSLGINTFRIMWQNSRRVTMSLSIKLKQYIHVLKN